MRVLVACEESQVVCTAFRDKGHEAYSCDLQPCSGGHPEWHLQCDALEMLKIHWDMIVAHPPCTYLTNAGAVRLFERDHTIKDREREAEGWRAKAFFMAFYNAECDKVAIENPVPLKYWNLPKYTQIIEPYMFGDAWRKRTCLWLRGLPPLFCTDIVVPEGLWTGSTSAKKSNYTIARHRSPKLRSRSFAGVGRAMAQQWG